jgi:PIN domain nuclease of toxin-antitoxin system
LDLVLERWSLAFQETREAPLILLDTNALLWLHSGHRRARALLRRAGRLYASPASLLEIQMLLETGRVRLRGAATVAQIVRDDRWLLDDPSAAAWFERTLAIGWTRDPFDRLLVAHAALRNWRLATGDEALIARLGDSRTWAL